MTRLPAAHLSASTAIGRGAPASVIGALALALSAPVGAQQQPGTFSLPPATPAPTPAPAGPADERAGVAIPPRPMTAPADAEPREPVPPPSATPTASFTPREVAPRTPAGTPQSPSAPAPAAKGAVADAALPDASAPAAPAAPTVALPVLPEARTAPVPDAATEMLGASILPEWWPWAAGGAGVLAVLGGAGLIGRRRAKRKPQRLAAPVAKTAASDASPAEADLPRLDLALDITAATRSVMMFTLEYRLTIANRTDRAVNDLSVALQLACARASGGAGSAQALEQIARIGPHQAQSLTGTLQLPLSAITPLRQGTTPLFVPLAHVTLEGEGQRALTRSFVIGPPSASGRVHPISLDQPPGGMTGLKAQAIAIPAVSAAA